MPKGKARYPAFQMYRKHITALSPTQTYTPKRTRTPLIHIRCILPRFPSWHLNELPLECRCERNLRLTSSELPVLRVNQHIILMVLQKHLRHKLPKSRTRCHTKLHELLEKHRCRRIRLPTTQSRRRSSAKVLLCPLCALVSTAVCLSHP